MEDPLVTIRQFANVVYAQIAQGVLEAAGIRCFLADENMGMHSLPLIAVRLQVPASEAEDALKILAEADEAPPAESAAEEVTEAVTECPRCGSQDIFYGAKPHGSASSRLVRLGLPVFLPWRKWRCRSCGHAWKR